MNASPVETFEGAAAIFTFAAQEGMVKGIFWAMCAVLVLVVLSSMIHEVAIGRKASRRHRR